MQCNKKFSQTNCPVLFSPTIPCSDGHLFKSNNCRSFYSHFQQYAMRCHWMQNTMSCWRYVSCPMSCPSAWRKRTDPTDKYKTIKICPFIINSISVRDKDQEARARKVFVLKTIQCTTDCNGNGLSNQPVSFSCLNRTLHQVILFLYHRRGEGWTSEWMIWKDNHTKTHFIRCFCIEFIAMLESCFCIFMEIRQYFEERQRLVLRIDCCVLVLIYIACKDSPVLVS